MMSLAKVLFGCLLLAAVQAPDSPPKPDADKDEEKAARMEYMKKAAKGYEIALAADSARKLVLTEEPVLRFDDQVTGVLDGTVFVWTLDGRPAATASVWIRKTGQEFHEFQSLAEAALVASNDGDAKWAPEVPGVEMKPATGAPPPAATAVARLAQMRAMAREYTARIYVTEKETLELRLLTQPAVRYGRADGEVVDGGLFAYCKGTNPEVLLLVEAVKNGGRLEWRSAFARMTSRGCEVSRADAVVWSRPRTRQERAIDPYYNIVQRYKGPGGPIDPPPARDE